MRPRLTTPPRVQVRPLVRPRFYGIGSTRPYRAANRFANLGTSPASAPAITETGMKGFLKWCQREYPPEIYQQIAAAIQHQFPQAFSSYMLGGWRKYAKLNGLADGTTGTVDTSDAANSTPSNPSWADQISEIIGTITGAYVTGSQAQATQANQQAILQAQLQQAQAGKPPLNVSLSDSGIAFATGAGLTTGGLLLIGGLGYLLLKAAKVI